MRIRLKNGTNAPKNSSIFRFCNRTGKSVDEYYVWAKECGQRASNNYKDRMLCKKFGLAEISEIKGHAAVSDDVPFSYSDINNFLLNEIQNPAELASNYLMAVANRDIDDSVPGFINSHLSQTTKQSFERFCDKNKLSDVSASWFSKDGLELDVQAMEMSTTFGREITEEAIVEYLTTYRKGKYRSYNESHLEKFEARMEELCGFKITEKYAMHLDNLVRGEIEVMADEDAPF